MRKKILAANWKMNLTHVEAESYIEAFLHEVGEVNDVEIVIIPSFTSIPILAQASGNAPFIGLRNYTFAFTANDLSIGTMVTANGVPASSDRKGRPLRRSLPPSRALS